jgi:uncharacterized RDD family membrane protein YckC
VDAQPAPNPYEAPRANLESHPPASSAAASLASRGQRLGGALVDLLLDMLARAIVYLGLSRQQVRAAGGNVLELYLRRGPWGYLAGATVLGLALLYWFLITTRGQSLGKIVARSRIVRMDGAPVDFVHGVVIRNWLLGVPALVLPMLGFPVRSGAFQFLFLVSLVEMLFIFGTSKRCLHDWVADTKVVSVSGA